MEYEMTSEELREELVRVFEQLTSLLDLKGEGGFRLRAYRNVAESIRGYDGDLVYALRENKFYRDHGIGTALKQKVEEYVSTRKLSYYDEVKAEFPSTILELLEIPGVGVKKVAVFYETLGIGSIAELKAACISGAVGKLPRFSSRTALNILEAIKEREKMIGVYCLGDLDEVAESLLTYLQVHEKVLNVRLCGSYRRGMEIVKNLNFVAASNFPSLVIENFKELPSVSRIIARDEKMISLWMEGEGFELQCELQIVSLFHFPFAVLHSTGSREHIQVLHEGARMVGMELTSEGLAGGPSGIQEEQDIYNVLGLQYITPELRENRGEIEAAAEGTLPDLVRWDDIRGTFHNHTNASDGMNTLEDMALMMMESGFNYLGIADHSVSSVQANGLNEERLSQQVQAIRLLNKAFIKQGCDFRVFAGSEVDILRDGSLDFEDEVLAKLDYCVASVHSSFQLDEVSMTNRVIKAMENPHVTMLGHVTGRILFRRNGYAIDLHKIIDCAVETNTIIELNCSPFRADMDWRWWRLAKEKGVKTSINADAHHVRDFLNLKCGVKWARKGWLTRADIVNCLSLQEVESWLNVPGLT